MLGGLALGWWTLRGDPARDEPGPPADPIAARPSAPPRTRADPQLATPAGISGTVRGPGGPLAGAHVCAWSLGPGGFAGATPRCTDAGPDGYYALDALPPLRHTVHASAAEHQPAGHPKDLSLKPGERRTGVDITLADGGARVRGRVRDISGGDIEGAWVSNYDTGPGRGVYFHGGAAATRSDPDGRFTLWLRPGLVGLFAQAEGYTTGHASGNAPGQAFELVLTPESVLVGRVVRADSDAPVAGARVSAISDWSDGGMPSVGVAYTDGDGRFRVPQLQPGRYKPTVEAEAAYGEAERSVHLGLGETSDPVTIRVHPVASVRGRVVVRGGGTCPQGQIYLASRGVGLATAGELDPDGSVLFPAVQPGSYDVQILCPALRVPPSFPPVVVAREPVADLVWELECGLRIRGVVVDAHGAPVSGVATSANVRFTPDGPPGPPPVGGLGEASDALGRFEIGGLLPGSYALTAHAEGHVSPRPLDVELGDGDLEDIRITLPPAGAIVGVVVDDRGDPARGIFVLAVGEPDAEAMYPATAGGQSGDDGSFALRGLPPGDYRVHAERPAAMGPVAAPDARPDDVAARVRADEAAEVRLVVPAARGRIDGQVQAPDGSPVTDAFIAYAREGALAGGDARQQVRWGSGEQPVLTDADGGFAVEGLVDGSYVLRAYRRGGGEAFAEHVPVGGRATLTIEPTAAIAGELRGEPPEVFAVAIVERATMFQRSEEFYRSAGRWGFEGLPPGSYELTFEGPTGTARQTVELRADERREDLRVELTPPGRIRGRVVDGATQEPIAGVRVHAYAAEARTRFANAGADAPVSDRDGRFEIDRIIAGPVYLSAGPADPTAPFLYFGSTQTVVEPGRAVEVTFALTAVGAAPPGGPEP